MLLATIQLTDGEFYRGAWYPDEGITVQEIRILLPPEQETLVLESLRRLASGDRNKGTKVDIFLTAIDAQGSKLEIAGGASKHIPATSQAIVEVLTGQTTAEDARYALSP